MRFLDTFRLVDSAAYLVVGAFKDRFFLGPHGQDHLHGFAKAPQAVRSVRIVIAIGAALVLEPTSAYAKIEPPMAQHVDRAGHLREQRGVTISVAGDRLTHAHALCVTCQCRCGCPALERDFLRWLRDSME